MVWFICVPWKSHANPDGQIEAPQVGAGLEFGVVAQVPFALHANVAEPLGDEEVATAVCPTGVALRGPEQELPLADQVGDVVGEHCVGAPVQLGFVGPLIVPVELQL